MDFSCFHTAAHDGHELFGSFRLLWIFHGFEHPFQRPRACVMCWTCSRGDPYVVVPALKAVFHVSRSRLAINDSCLASLLICTFCLTGWVKLAGYDIQSPVGEMAIRENEGRDACLLALLPRRKV